MYTIIMGKSTAGKDTVARMLCSGVSEKISSDHIYEPTYTTRPPRPKETDGIDYHFISPGTFARMQENDEFAEHKDYTPAQGGVWSYGSKLTLEKLHDDKNHVIILTPAGFKDVKDYFERKEPGSSELLTSIYLKVSEHEQRKRLMRRGDDPKEAARRIEADAKDFEDAEGLADFTIDNNSRSIQSAVWSVISAEETKENTLRKKERETLPERIKETEGYKMIMETCHATPQRTPHHKHDVGDHIEAVVNGIPEDYKDDGILIAAAMLHDIGKPAARKPKTEDRDSFKGHVAASAVLAGSILDEAGITGKDREHILWLVANHEMRDAVPDETLEKMLDEAGISDMQRLFVLRYADVNGQSEYKHFDKMRVVDDAEKQFKKILNEREIPFMPYDQKKIGDIIHKEMSKEPKSLTETSLSDRVIKAKTECRETDRTDASRSQNEIR